MAAKKKAKAKKKVVKSKAVARVPLVVTSKAKEFVKSNSMKTAGDTVEALNAKVYGILEDAIARAQANKRSTLRPQDL